MHAGEHPLHQGGLPRTWSHHTPETKAKNIYKFRLNQEPVHTTHQEIKPNQISIQKKKNKQRSNRLDSCPLPDLAMDDDPAILPGRVPYDIGGGEELLGAGHLILRHGLHHHSLAPPAPRFNLRGLRKEEDDAELS